MAVLDDFKDGQPIAYQLITNSIKNNRLVHAYIIETNGYSYGLDLALSFAKSLLCPHNYFSLNSCQNCNQCQLIDDGNFLESVVINPDGLWIKKEQLSNLQFEFSKKALLGNKKVYIINGAEKLNAVSSNSILKFLEEPPIGIYAILLTENANQISDTIKSRCQHISLINVPKELEGTKVRIAHALYNNKEQIEEFIASEKTDLFITTVLKFIECIEKEGKNSFLFTYSMWFSTIKEKEENIVAYKIMLMFYKDVLNCILKRKNEVFLDNESLIIEVAKIEKIEGICHKLDKIVETISKVGYNINMNLLMDKLLMEMII